MGYLYGSESDLIVPARTSLFVGTARVSPRHEQDIVAFEWNAARVKEPN
jgi:hypothetical protein